MKFFTKSSNAKPKKLEPWKTSIPDTNHCPRCGNQPNGVVEGRYRKGVKENYYICAECGFKWIGREDRPDIVWASKSGTSAIWREDDKIDFVKPQHLLGCPLDVGSRVIVYDDGNWASDDHNPSTAEGREMMNKMALDIAKAKRKKIVKEEESFDRKMAAREGIPYEQYVREVYYRDKLGRLYDNNRKCRRFRR